MSRIVRFGFGGLGGLLPILASLAAVDLTVFASLIDKHMITEGLCVGYAVRVIVWFALGGIVASLNSEVRNPWALVQIGIAAPALVTSYLSGAAIAKTQGVSPSVSLSLIAPAYAGDLDVQHQITVADGFFNEVWKGLTPGLSVEKSQIDSGPPSKPIQPTMPTVYLTKPIKVTNQKTSFCFNVPPDQAKTLDDLARIQESFRAPDFTVANGACE